MIGSPGHQAIGWSITAVVEAGGALDCMPMYDVSDRSH
jgi:hypothetical protein